MRSGESILFALPFRNVLLHLLLTPEVERDRAINLLEAQRWIV